MSPLPALRILTVVLGFAGSASAMAACTDAQAEAKMTELMNLMGPLMARNAPLTETLSSEMTSLMTAPVTEQTCVGYDRLIARARAGR
ncbi:MAG: hypothetical protein V4653_03295 [Pseudomonadota bacterium]